jgi:predicted metal-dependent peptidase
MDLARRQVAEDIQAAAKQPGSVPAGLERWANELISPTVPWRRVLAGAIRSSWATVAGMTDYSYRRPSRRQSTQPSIVLPALRRPVPEVALVIDTSGSMSAADLTACLSEVQGVLKTIGTSAVVISVDTEAHVSGRAHAARAVRLKGGGGTNMGSGIEKAAGLRPKPHICIVLTDGYTPWPDYAPREMRVIVASTSTESGPVWARTVHIDMSDHRR